MNRRDVLHGAGVAALAACVNAVRTPPRDEVHAVAFDLFTVFDPRGVHRRVAEVVRDDPASFATVWLSRLFEYCWLHGLAQRYVPFDRLVLDALGYAARTRGLAFRAGDRDRLAGAFTALEPWPDAREALGALRDRGLRLAPLANFSPPMIRDLLAAAELTELFDLQLSTDEAHTYKPDPRAYALAEQHFALRRDQIAFAAFGRWDAWGAASFGLRTFWVNRLASSDELGAAVASGPALTDAVAWLASGAPAAASARG